LLAIAAVLHIIERTEDRCATNGDKRGDACKATEALFTSMPTTVAGRRGAAAMTPWWSWRK